LSHILAYLPYLACPISMGLLMWVMMRSSGDPKVEAHPDHRVARLQSELDRLWEEARSRGIADQSRPPGGGVPEPLTASPSVSCPTPGGPGAPGFWRTVFMCFNWRILAGLGAVEAGLVVAMPQLAVPAIPVELALICPISMVLMAKRMRPMGGDVAGSPPGSRDALVAETPSSTIPASE